MAVRPSRRRRQRRQRRLCREGGTDLICERHRDPEAFGLEARGRRRRRELHHEVADDLSDGPHRNGGLRRTSQLGHLGHLVAVCELEPAVPVDDRDTVNKRLGAELARHGAEHGHEILGNRPDEGDELLALGEPGGGIAHSTEVVARGLLVPARPRHAERHLARQEPDDHEGDGGGDVRLFGDREPVKRLRVEIGEGQGRADRGPHDGRSAPARAGRGGREHHRQRHDHVAVTRTERDPEDRQPCGGHGAEDKRGERRSEDRPLGQRRARHTAANDPLPPAHAPSIRTPSHVEGADLVRGSAMRARRGAARPSGTR